MPPLSRILIVDDNADHRLILTYQLARIGPFEIHETGDGQQALVVIATTPPDLIFMNLGLPLLDGYQAGQRPARGFLHLLHGHLHHPRRGVPPLP